MSLFKKKEIARIENPYNGDAIISDDIKHISEKPPVIGKEAIKAIGDNMIAVSSDIRDKVVVYLNQCLQEDNKAVQKLCADIPVNNLSDANPIVCRINNGVVTTSALGLLNGALEAIYGRPNPVYAVMRSENDSLILRFE
jgi:hypothetical protein